MTVYVDVVILVNFILNYIILNCVMKLSGAKGRKKGIAISSTVGGLYSVFMFEKSFEPFYSPFVRFVFTILMIIIAFKINGNILKLVFYFYITAFAFSGLISFVANLNGVVIMKNGMYYVENSIWIIILAGVAGFFVIRYVMMHMKKNRIRYGEKTLITVCIEGKNAEIRGMLDTGNSLLDPITLYPVIVVEYDSIKSILPDEIKEFMKEGNDLNCNINRRYLNRIRLIPCNAVGHSEILKGFRPDYVKFEDKEERVEDVIVAVIYRKLSANDEFNAIMHPMV